MKVKIRRVIAFVVFLSSIFLLSLMYSSLNTLLIEYSIQTKSRKIVEIKQEDRYYIYVKKTVVDSLDEARIVPEEDSVSTFSTSESSSGTSNYEVDDEIEITNLSTNESIIVRYPNLSNDILGEYYIIGEVILDEGDYIISYNQSDEFDDVDSIAIGNTWAADFGEEKIENIQYGLLMITLSSISYLLFSFIKKS